MTQTLELSTRIRQLEQQVASLPSLEFDLVRLTSEIQDAHAAREKLEQVDRALKGNVLVLVPEPPVDPKTVPAAVAPAEPPTLPSAAPEPAPAPEPEPAPEPPAAIETPAEVPVAAKVPRPASRPTLNPETDVLNYFAANPSESLAKAVAAALPHLSLSTVSAALKSLTESGQLERSGAGTSASPYWYSAKSVDAPETFVVELIHPLSASQPTLEPPKPKPAPAVDKPAPRAETGNPVSQARTERVTHQANLPRDIPPLSSKSAVATPEEQARVLEILKSTPNGLSSSLLNSKLNKDRPIRFDVLIANLEALRNSGKAQAQEGKWRLI